VTRFRRQWTTVLLSLAVMAAAVPRADFARSSGHATVDDSVVLRLLDQLNHIPETNIDDQKPPTLTVLKTLYDVDGPEFLRLRRLVGKAAVRRKLNPTVKAEVGEILSQRWDTFVICGNLFLSGMRSPNRAMRELARRKLIIFFHPAFVPEIIHQLQDPVAHEEAYSTLKEISGKTYPPEARIWKVWYERFGKNFDYVGHILRDTLANLVKHPIIAFDQSRFWYAPPAVRDVRAPDEEQTPEERSEIEHWNTWVQHDVRRYVFAWRQAKPLLERVVHQPDPRVNQALQKLLADAGYGDYASLALAWRASNSSLPAIEQSNARFRTPGRVLARGSMGDKRALRDLVDMIEAHPQPSTIPLMSDEERKYVPRLHAAGVLPAEQALELLCHRSFGFDGAATARDKAKATRKAKQWLDKNLRYLVLDRRRAYYFIPNPR